MRQSWMETSDLCFTVFHWQQEDLSKLLISCVTARLFYWPFSGFIG